jgi:RimJ/RimL family protein N-acetyltransferase
MNLRPKKEITIRPFRAEDSVALYDAIQESLEELPRWMPDLNRDLTLEEIRVWIGDQANHQADGTAYNFAIVDVRNDQLLGGCGITQINRRHQFANLYYWVRSSCTRQGVATQAVLQLARYGFDELGLQRIEIVMSVDNPASIRVAEKAGAVREGRLRNRIVAQGRPQDAFMFTFIPQDFQDTGGDDPAAR